MVSKNFSSPLRALATIALAAPLLLGCEASAPSRSDQAAIAGAPTQDQECLPQRFNATKPASVTSLNCTANDVRIAQFINLDPSVTSCVDGEMVTVPIQAEVIATSTERWDVGLFIAEDGKDPNILWSEPGGSQNCFNDYLHPVSADNSDVDVVDGLGPFYNGELGVVAKDGTSDLCGDLQQGVDTFHDVNDGNAISFVCQDPDNDGFADIPACTVWANSATTKNDATSCQDQYDTTAETTAKCTCEQVHIDIRVRKHGTITVNKVLEPATDGGKFNLQIDGETRAADVGNDGTTGAVIVDAGLVPPGTGLSHSVGEIAGTGTSLGDYNSSIECSSGQGHSASASGTGPLSFTVLPDEDWTCTITNSLKPAHLTLVKRVTNDSGGTAAATDWTLSAAGPTTISGVSGAAAVTSAEVPPGTYALAESGGPDGYSAGSWSCVGGTLVGSSVTLAPDGSATCTIINDDQTAHLTLVKVVTNDNGGTALTTAWTLSASGPTPLSGAGGADGDVNAGVYTLAESGGPDGYSASAWSCVGGSQSGSSITLALGQSATCTITNDDIAPSLTLIKHVINDSGGTALETAWTLSASGPSPLSGTTPVASGATFQAGVYTLGETGPAGYSASAWSCSGGGTLDVNSLTIGVGETVTCEITNDDIAPKLTLVKTVTNDDGGDAVVADFPLFVNSTQVVSGEATTLVPGTYVASETTLSGYTPSAWGGDCAADGSITLALGDDKTCTITNDDQPGHIDVLKTVQGLPPSGDQSFTFQLRAGATPTATGTILETQVIDAANGGAAVPFTTDLDANTHYQLCEIVMPGWLIAVDSLTPFVPAKFLSDGTTPNPDVDNSVQCVDFTLDEGQTLDLTVDNTPPPGGLALTIGFWKNWASCKLSKGHQDPVLDDTLVASDPNGIVVSAGSGSYPAFGDVFYLVLHSGDCAEAVSLLNKTPIGSTRKAASDPAFGLAAQLVAAELNYAADAYQTPAATQAITDAVLLLGKYHFNGSTHLTISAADAVTMRNLAARLDAYNNNLP